MNIPTDLKYTKEHEWIKIDGNLAVVGITDYAQGELGDIVFVELPSAGDDVKAGEPFGTIEAVKAVSEIFSPLSGKAAEVNELLEDDPMVINSDPYGDGWMIKIEFSDAAELDSLLSSDDYLEIIK
ncbi:MAG: glycine cleavage system protein GcvH [Candidatus Zixiibacteriota bacterium]|nr:MAG: glycine cleavage system protein GcvH [candidate division Zixibacteria bacterium]HHI02751.1 glycine cleavage system protein GcvH [candidate division Zixibacteria bacterium]